MFAQVPVEKLQFQRTNNICGRHHLENCVEAKLKVQEYHQRKVTKLSDSSAVHEWDRSAQLSGRCTTRPQLLQRFYRRFLFPGKIAKSARSRKQQWRRNSRASARSMSDTTSYPMRTLIEGREAQCTLLHPLRLKQCQGFLNDNPFSSAPHGDFRGILKYSGW